MMKSKVKKLSPKKAESIEDAILTMEFQIKKMSQKFKSYHEQTEQLGKSVVLIEGVIKKDIAMKAADLYKEYSNASDLVTKLAKELETVQKQYHKKQSDLEKKFLTPLATGQFSTLKPDTLQAIKANVEKLQTALLQIKKPLDEYIASHQHASKRLAAIEAQILYICLPEQLEEICKLNDKFNTYAELLCEETAHFDLKTSQAGNSNAKNAAPNSEQTEYPAKIQGSLTFLYKAHQKGAQLLEQVQRNLGGGVQTISPNGPADSMSMAKK